MSEINYKVLDLERTNPITGYTETVVYTGSKKNKPKGWRIKKERWVCVVSDEFGLTGKYY